MKEKSGTTQNISNMLNVYGIQLSAWYPAATLPQALGTIWSYANSFPEVSGNYKLVKIFWENEDANTICHEIKDPDVIFCSCYIWNWEKTYQAIQTIKEQYPYCLIVIGGPEPRYEVEWMKKHPEVDVLIPYYGETVFKNVLIENIGSKDFSSLAGVITKHSYNRNHIYPEFHEIPSPYLNGLFDDLLKNKRHDTLGVRCVFESNRGCPYSCTFCDIGSTAYQKVKQFDMDRCFQELEWITKNNISAVDVADANFGIFPRDEEIIDALIEFKNKHNWKGRFLPTWSKTKGDRIVRLAKKVIHNGLDTIFGLSLQSLNQETLDNVKRKNAFTLEEMSDIIKDMNDSDIAVYTELVFPMPGDTYQNFKSGMENLLDLNRTFNKFQINQLSLLNNAEFNDPGYNKKFNLKWSNIQGFTKHYYGDKFTDNICTATSTMNVDEVFESLFLVKSFYKPMYFYGVVQGTCDTLHGLGIENRSSILNKSYDFLKTKNWFKEHKEECRDHYFSAIYQKSHYGWNVLEDKMNFFPEYAVSHMRYIENNIHEHLKEVFPEYSELIDLDYHTLWKGKKETIELEVYNYKPGIWLLSDEREYDREKYLSDIYITGRFDNRWKKQSIKNVND